MTANFPRVDRLAPSSTPNAYDYNTFQLPVKDKKQNTSPPLFFVLQHAADDA